MKYSRLLLFMTNTNSMMMIILYLGVAKIAHFLPVKSKSIFYNKNLYIMT